MLTLIRTNLPTTDDEGGVENKGSLNCMVQILDEKGKAIEGCPDLVFSVKSYQKIARDNSLVAETDSNGDEILLPVNLFFKTLSQNDHMALYLMYKEAQRVITDLDEDNWRDARDTLHEYIFKTFRNLKIDSKAIAFCQGAPFRYPDLSLIGLEAHHTEAKTFKEADYKEITAIAVLTKIMIPVWGYLFAKLSTSSHNVRQREQLAFELIETTLEDGAFERIYNKLYHYFRSVINDIRKNTDKKPSNTASTSFILTHNGIDDQMFETSIMSTVLVKRLASFDCFTTQDTVKSPDVMVYVCELAKHSVDSTIRTMRGAMRTLPKREIANHDSEDNSSIIDHISRTSSKSIDVPILVAIAVENWEIDKLLVEYDIPMEVYTSAVRYYQTNGFGVSAITQAMVASFIGTRFGGSKCINYLPPHLYQKIVIILQIFLIRHDLVDLASLASAIESAAPVEGASSVLLARIHSNYEKSAEYISCKDTFKGYIDKPLPIIGKKIGNKKKQETDRIDFVNHIKKMIDRLTMFSHMENMAPALWDFTKVEAKPIIGTECQFDENVIRHLCRFYLLFHEKKPTVNWA